MSRPMVEIIPIDEIIADLRLRYKRWAEDAQERYVKDCEEEIAKVIANRPALADLHAAGVAFAISKWTTGSDVSIYLGFFAHNKRANKALADKVRNIRLTLGCRLENTGKDIANEKKRTIRFTLTPVNFTGIRIKFDRKLPRVRRIEATVDGQPPPKRRECRLVKRSYMALECS
jgi:hypothetical protein